MEAAKKSKYDKSLSRYGGMTVPIEDIPKIFRNGKGKQYYAQRRRNRDGISEYCVVYDSTNWHYAGWLYRLAQAENALPKFTSVLGINMEKWADAVEVFLGALELAERTTELRKIIPFSVPQLRIVVETSIRGFTNEVELALSRNKRSVKKNLPQLPSGYESWDDVIDWDEDYQYSNIASDEEEQDDPMLIDPEDEFVAEGVEGDMSRCRFCGNNNDPCCDFAVFMGHVDPFDELPPFFQEATNST